MQSGIKWKSVLLRKPVKGNVSANIWAYIKFIELALTFNAEAIFFSDYSLTDYELGIAKN